MNKKYIIYAPSYDELSGGAIVLHKLCSLMNELGYEAYLHPRIKRFELKQGNLFKTLRSYFKEKRREKKRIFKTNSSFNTPIYKGKNTNFDENFVIIYPEVTAGNPLDAKNVVRWFLHQPGYHTGKIYFEKNELYFKFNDAIKNFDYPGSKTSGEFLKIISYPIEYYNQKNVSKDRKGIAYCLRKGKGKELSDDLKDAILIDGKSHKEVSEIFKKVKTFVSYDTYTAYSFFAVLCGCESIVIPDEGVSKEEWYPSEKNRYGIAYGMEKDELENAKYTAHLVEEFVIQEELKNKENVKKIIKEVNNYFE